MHRILVIEDDRKLNQGICLTLKSPEYRFTQCETIKEVTSALKETSFDLVILDLNLPDGNGLDFLEDYRKSTLSPVIILTANNMESDIVTGLELGANDYITKPFSLMVLKARVDVQLRDNISAKTSAIYQKDSFLFDFDKMHFTVDQNAIELSKTEQRLLRLLIENSGRTLSRNQLIDNVWSGDTAFVDDHALTVTIKRLRDKLGENTIKTIYGIGYAWAVK